MTEMMTEACGFQSWQCYKETTPWGEEDGVTEDDKNRRNGGAAVEGDY